MCQERKNVTPKQNEKKDINAPPIYAAKDSFLQEFCDNYCKYPCLCMTQDDLDYQCYEKCDMSLRLDKLLERLI